MDEKYIAGNVNIRFNVAILLSRIPEMSPTIPGTLALCVVTSCLFYGLTFHAVIIHLLWFYIAKGYARNKKRIKGVFLQKKNVFVISIVFNIFLELGVVKNKRKELF